METPISRGYDRNWNIYRYTLFIIHITNRFIYEMEEGYKKYQYINNQDTPI